MSLHSPERHLSASVAVITHKKKRRQEPSEVLDLFQLQRHCHPLSQQPWYQFLRSHHNECHKQAACGTLLCYRCSSTVLSLHLAPRGYLPEQEYSVATRTARIRNIFRRAAGDGLRFLVHHIFSRVELVRVLCPFRIRFSFGILQHFRPFANVRMGCSASRTVNLVKTPQ